MPKTTSKSFKKKKYNARFPPARIKKIMQTDEDVGKVAAAVPVIISRALEMFIESLIADASKLTQAKNAKTLSTSHIKQAITSTNQYDFLRDLVKNVPDHQTEDCNGDAASNGESSLSVKRGRGRPRNIDNVSYQKKRTDGNRSSSEDDEDEEEDVTDDTETDEEASSSNQVHNPLQPSFPDNNMSHNNNNNYVLTAAENASCSMPILRDSLISGKNIPQVLLPHDQSVSGDCPIALQQPPYQMPTSFNMPSNLAPHLHPNYNYSYPNNSSHLHPSSTLSPIILPSVLPQPVNLTNSLQQEQGAKKDDDYDT